MLFGKPKPTVTKEDQDWIENSFLFFEEQYGRDFLKSVPIIEPTKDFFDREFTGTEEDAEFALQKVTEYMDIKEVHIDLYFFNEAPMEFEDEGIRATTNPEGDKFSDNYAVGKYSEKSMNRFEVGLEVSKLNDPQSMIATIAHELSHLILLGEGRIEENDEALTDLNCIALGFGIFIGNSIFSFQQWQGVSHQGWQANRTGYIPEEVASFAMALFQNYQDQDDSWTRHLNRSMGKLYLKNIKHIKAMKEEIKFK